MGSTGNSTERIQIVCTSATYCRRTFRHIRNSSRFHDGTEWVRVDQNLWDAVLEQAFSELAGVLSLNPLRREVAEKARDFLLSDHIQTAVDFLGLEKAPVREAARRLWGHLTKYKWTLESNEEKET